MPSLDIHHLTVRFGAFTALDDLRFAAEAGQVTCLLGANGAGKTTVIRACTGLVEPMAGTISIAGSQPGSPIARQAVGLMPQSTGAWSGITPVRLLTYLASLYANPHPVDDLMARLGIHPFASTPYRRLSGGQQQAVNLAGALVGRPELVFLDEPTAGVDVRGKRRVWELVEQLRDAAVTVVLTTHDMTEAEHLADHVWIIDSGRNVIDGPVAELTRSASLEELFLSHTREDRT